MGGTGVYVRKTGSDIYTDVYIDVYTVIRNIHQEVYKLFERKQQHRIRNRKRKETDFTGRERGNRPIEIE